MILDKDVQMTIESLGRLVDLRRPLAEGDSPQDRNCLGTALFMVGERRYDEAIDPTDETISALMADRPFRLEPFKYAIAAWEVFSDTNHQGNPLGGTHYGIVVSVEPEVRIFQRDEWNTDCTERSFREIDEMLREFHSNDSEYLERLGTRFYIPLSIKGDFEVQQSKREG